MVYTISSIALLLARKLIVYLTVCLHENTCINTIYEFMYLYKTHVFIIESSIFFFLDKNNS